MSCIVKSTKKKVKRKQNEEVVETDMKTWY